MRTVPRALMLSAALLLFAAPRTLAQVNVYTGGGGSGDNVLWNTGDQYGFSVTGTINGTSFHVTADNNGSGQTLHASGGQATVDAVQASDHGVSVPLYQLGVETESGVGFEEYIFDASRSSFTGTTTIAFQMYYVDLAHGTYLEKDSLPFTINQGSNWFTFLADPGYLFTRIAFKTTPTADTVQDGLDSAKQLRLTGAQYISPPTVPEGSSLALLLGGLVPFGALRWRRRRA